MKRYQIFLIAFAALFLLVGAVSASNVDNVTNGTVNDGMDVLSSEDFSEHLEINRGFSGDKFSELQTEINVCDDNDTIILKNDIYQDGVNPISIGKPLTIDGNGHSIDAQKKSRVFHVLESASNVTIKNLIIKNAKHDDFGGAICWNGGYGSVYNCTFTNNTAANYAGAIFWMGIGGSVYNCTFINNAATQYGGAIEWDGNNGNVYNCTFINNIADFRGGAIFWQGMYGNVSYCVFLNNSAAENGDAIYGNRYIMAYYCWFGNNETNYNGFLPIAQACYCEYRLFLNSTAKPDTISSSDTSDIIFKLYLYDSKTGHITEHDNTPFKHLDLTITATNGKVSKKIAKLGESIQFTPTTNGPTTVTATVGNVAQTVGIQVKGDFEILQDLVNNESVSVINLERNYTYNVFDRITEGVRINRPITINGNGYTIDAKGKSRIFLVEADNVTIKNVTFINGNAIDGGAICWSVGNGSVHDCIFINNKAGGNGGAIYSEENCRLFYCNLVNNSAASSGGAIYFKNNQCFIMGCYFINNSANDGGAIYWAGSEGSIDFSRFIGNNASNRGGALFLDSVELIDIADSPFFNNCASFEGGAIYSINSSSSIGIAILINNSALHGGAIYCVDSYSSIEYCDFDSNVAGGDGGAILLNDSQCIITNSNFEFNAAGVKGGAIYWVLLNKDLDCNISSSRFLNNKAKSYSITITEEDGILTIEFMGWDNYINAIYTESIINLNDVTFWNGDITNTDVEYYIGSASGQNITLEIYDSNNDVVVNTTLKTNSYGEIYYKLFNLYDGCYTYRAYHLDDSYYTYVETSGNCTLDRSDSLITLDISDYDEFYYYGCNIPFDIINRTVVSFIVTNENESAVYLNGTVDFYSRHILLDLPVIDEYYKITVYNAPNGWYRASQDSKFFKILKTNSSISIDSIRDSFYGREVSVSWDFENKTDFNVTVYDVNEKIVYNVITGDDMVVLPLLAVGQYNITVTNIGTENVTESHDSKIFNILEGRNIVSVSANDVVYGNWTIITISAWIDGIYTVDINGMLGDIEVYNGEGKWEIILPAGDYYINATFKNTNYTSSITNTTCSVLKANNSVTVIANNVVYGSKTVIRILAQADGYYVLDVNGTLIDVTVVRGEGATILQLPVGKYYANATFLSSNYNNFITNATFAVFYLPSLTIDYNENILEGDNIIFNVMLSDNATGNIMLSFNGKDYNSTISNGSAVINVPDVKSGDYVVTVVYSGDDCYGGKEVNFNVHVKKVLLNAYDATYGWSNSIDYSVKLTDEDGNVVPNKEVLFSIDGKSFKSTTNEFGIASVGLSLEIGSYDIKISCLSQSITKNIKVVSRFSGNKNINMYYFDGTKYSVKVYGDDGKLVGANQLVTVKLNKKTYSLKTNKNGVVTLTIPNTVKPGTYTITATYKGQTIKNTIKVKKILTSKKTVKVKKTAKKLVLKANLKKKLKGKIITFKFKGKTYKAKTNKKGIAKVTINKKVINKLKRGKTYNVLIKYYKTSLKTKVRVK